MKKLHVTLMTVSQQSYLMRSSNAIYCPSQQNVINGTKYNVMYTVVDTTITEYEVNDKFDQQTVRRKQRCYSKSVKCCKLYV